VSGLGCLVESTCRLGAAGGGVAALLCSSEDEDDEKRRRAGGNGSKDVEGCCRADDARAMLVIRDEEPSDINDAADRERMLLRIMIGVRCKEESRSSQILHYRHLKLSRVICPEGDTKSTSNK
jgi:hypothetical protein